MERVFIGVFRADATRKADEWWEGQKGVRQTLRTEVAVGGKAPDARLDRWAIAIRFEDENSGTDRQPYLGHRNIQHTVRYMELSPSRFKDFWRQ